jgi:hypothetical protein
MITVVRYFITGQDWQFMESIEALSQTEEASEHFQNVIIGLIALAVVIGAVLIWRASLAEDQAGDADANGLVAAMGKQQATIRAYDVSYRDRRRYAAYTLYARNLTLLKTDLADIGSAGAEVSALESELRLSSDLAASLRMALPAAYLRASGVYDTEREFEERLAEESKKQDVNPEPHFAAAAASRQKTRRLLGLAATLGISLVGYTLAQMVPWPAGRWGLVALSSMVMIAVVIAGVAVEMSL